MQRVCFLLKVKKDRIEDYMREHRVWPEMLEVLSAAGFRNYSLFVRKEDGLLVGYFEAEDPQAALKRIAESDVSRRWEALMEEFFERDPADPRKRCQHWLEHYFLLE